MKQHKMIKIAAVLLILVMYTTHLCSNLYARYITYSSSSDSARVAGSVLEFYLLEEGQLQTFELDLSQMVPGDQYKYDLVFCNYNEEVVSEVQMEYAITLKTTGNLPLAYTISPLEDSQDLFLQTSTNIYYWYDGVMKASEKTIQKYTLTVSWDKSKNNPYYADEIDLVEVSLTASQQD